MSNDYNASEIDRLVREGRDASPNPQDICHCCCIRPAVRRAVARHVTWVSLCDVCLDKHYPKGNYSRGDYFPPDGELIQRNLVATLCDALSAAKAEVERLNSTAWASMCDCIKAQRDEARADRDRLSAELDESERLNDKLLLDRHEDAQTIDRLAAEVERLTVQLAGAEVANAAVTETLVEHSELTGHMEIVEQCRDYLAHEATDSGDPSGKLQDFADSLRVVIDQLDRQCRSRNWYEVAYTAGKQKLIEHALSRVCCKGEPHTCDQEAVAAAEGRADRLIVENDRLAARVRELELTEEEREVLRVAGDWLMRLHEVPSGDADPALALLDRLVKGGR